LFPSIRHAMQPRLAMRSHSARSAFVGVDPFIFNFLVNRTLCADYIIVMRLVNDGHAITGVHKDATVSIASSLSLP
jgi:hypothetical protein